MTKRQFLKRSAKCMDETGGLLLLLRQIIDKEFQRKISNEEASKKVDSIRKEIEFLFFEFEKLNPPSKCAPLKQKILKALINLQEVVVTDCESLLAAKEGKKEKSQKKLKESMDLLEEFRKDFYGLTKEVNILLTEKKKK